MKTPNIFDIRDSVLVRCTVNDPDVIIPNGVTAIGSHAFEQENSIDGQDALCSVVIPESVTRIRQGAFAYCRNLRKVTVLGPADIEGDVFKSCENLTEVFLADGVKSIGGYCFAFCDKLHELYIPGSVTHIGYDIARMNEADDRYPQFICYSQGAGKDWHEDWNRIYNDPRFGDEKRYAFYHPTYYGRARDKQERDDLAEPVPVTDIPHGTGVKPLPVKKKRTGKRLPPIRLRLWLDATQITITGTKEFRLNDEQREILPRLLREQGYDESAEHRLNEPWEVTLQADTWNFVPELKISAWINRYQNPFDGETLVISHDMPWQKTYDEAPVSRLQMGQTVIAEKHITNGNFLDIMDVRLFIQWPEQEIPVYTTDEVTQDLINHKPEWAGFTDADNELAVFFARGDNDPELFKRYEPSVFPEQFIADLKQEQDKWADLTEISVQPCELYEVECDYSDDYKCAAGYSDDDDTGWTETHRREILSRLTYEIDNSNE